MQNSFIVVCLACSEDGGGYVGDVMYGVDGGTEESEKENVVANVSRCKKKSG